MVWLNLFCSSRGPADEGKKAAVYKSEKRAELVKEGYVIQGSLGDQWSDLIGFALPNRSFKLPNPMYYIPWTSLKFSFPYHNNSFFS